MRKQDLAGLLLLVSFLFIVAAGYLLPKSDFSDMEKRYLAEAPEFNWDNVSSGEWSSQAEDYLSDRVLGRNFFVGINAYMEKLAGRQHLKDVWVWEGKLVEAPVAFDGDAVARNMAAINALADSLDRKVTVMLVPSAGWASGIEGYSDEEIIKAAYAAAGERVSTVSVEDIFRGRPELYYDTDHHWTSEGAYEGYAAFAEAVGRDYRAAEDFTVTAVEGFQGSTYSRSALWLTPSETLELWHGSDRLTVTNAESEEVHEGIFYTERLEEADKYTVFLDGNHSVVRVTNPEKEGKLLVIRDSYANCLGTLLANQYAEVVLVDLRYWKTPVSELTAEGFDDVLVCYSLYNFLTDANFPWLK